MKKSIMFLMAGMLLLSANVFAGTSCCKDNGCGMDKGEKHDKMMKKMDKKLNLTAEQSTQIEAIRTTCRTECEKRSTDLQNARQAKMEAMKQNPPDFAAAKAKTQEIDGLMTQNKMAMMDAKEKEYAVLTPEQKEKYSKMTTKHMEKMKDKNDKKDDKD